MVPVLGGQCCHCTSSFSWPGFGYRPIGHGCYAIFLEEGAAAAPFGEGWNFYEFTWLCWGNPAVRLLDASCCFSACVLCQVEKMPPSPPDYGTHAGGWCKRVAHWWIQCWGLWPTVCKFTYIIECRLNMMMIQDLWFLIHVPIVSIVTLYRYYGTHIRKT